MSWLKIDDNAPQHPKVLEAGPEAAWLWLSAIAYSRRNLTDGFIPATGLGTLGPFRRPQQLADRLVTVGLFEPVERGYLVHDYLDHNPSRSQVQDTLRADAERKERARDRYRPPKVSAESDRNPDGQSADASVLRSGVSSRARDTRAESESESTPPQPPSPARGAVVNGSRRLTAADRRRLAEIARVDAARPPWQCPHDPPCPMDTAKDRAACLGRHLEDQRTRGVAAR